MDRQSTTYILMKILRDSTLNTNVEKREQQQRFVHDRFQRSNTAIERGIRESSSNLGELTNDCLDVYTSIQQSKQRTENVRQRLKECQNLLLLKRQEIGKLWLLTSEQNALVRIYENIDELRKLPSRLDFYLKKNLFLHATFLLLKSKDFQEFRTINALNEIDGRLKEERFALEDRLCSELLIYLFERPSKEILTNKTFTTNRFDANLSMRSKENHLLRKEFDEGKLTIESTYLSLIPDEYLQFDLRQYFPNFYLEVLVQSLALLFHLNETLEHLQRKFSDEFRRVIYRTTDHILDNRFLITIDQHENLRTLFDLSFEQTKIIVKNIRNLLEQLRLLNERRASVQLRQNAQQCEHRSGRKEILFEIPQLFSLEFIFQTIEQVFVEVLHDYVDFNNTTTNLQLNDHEDFQQRTSFIDVSHYLMKKPPIRPTTIDRWFQFAHSDHFRLLNSTLQDQQNRYLVENQSTKVRTYQKYVCKPHYRNVTAIHSVLRRIISEIDTLSSAEGSKRILDRKLTEFIRDHFIDRVIKEIRQSSSVRTSNDRHRSVEVISLVLQKELKLVVPILQSTYLILKSCEELCGLVACLPSYADEFCRAMVDLLFQHRESSNKLFLSIVERLDSSSLISYQWVKDVDINRHLRTLPHFDEFVRLRKEKRKSTIDSIQQQQSKETETLLINFSQEEFLLDDICHNLKHIELLATLHESLDWLFHHVDEFFDVLEQSFANVSDPISLEIFSNALRTTSNLSLDILLVLYLEVRLHCFYYLSLLFRHTTAYAFKIDVDPDENILVLNRDLTNLIEFLQSNLNESKFFFVFQGLENILAQIFIRSLPNFHRLSETGVTKMCRNIFSVEQTLAQCGIVVDSGLTRAYEFYEFIVNVKPDEILQLIEQRGNDYSEQDYLNLVQLQHRNLPTNEDFHLKQIENEIKRFFHPK